MLVPMSRFWRAVLRQMYALLALLDPFIRRFWQRFGLGNVVELRVDRRSDGKSRSRLLGLLRTGGHEYLGHPNGHCGWTLDLQAAGRAMLYAPRAGRQREVRATLLEHGPEREAAILATNQHPFPGNLVYRLARNHIRAVGIYFRLGPVPAADEGGRR